MGLWAIFLILWWVLEDDVKATAFFGAWFLVVTIGVGFAHHISPPTQYLPIPLLTLVVASYISLTPHKTYSNYSRTFHVEYEIAEDGFDEE
jgi:hypothetical protein